ncbi:hypothetical protein AVEN_141667-1 [Araneus ventricosus]|uniref:Uncharacterized protein n=1 Tax=Araneus ventricosus TaxID=182803 RepID=A0A4Y2VMW2_ARAVE|nr:hypothetical protein AVEN_9504-1 [Araneus ventricosus]GBO25516.1 hypothetical protein AVEN_141667-1 [Araneus ventricosus]
MNQFRKNMMKKLLNAKFFLLEQLLTLPLPKAKQMEKSRLHSLMNFCVLSVQNALVLEKYEEKNTECQILTAEAVNTPAAENKADDIKSFVFLDERCHLEKVQTLQGEFEASYHSDIMSTADEVVAHEPNFYTAEILNANEVTKFSIEKTMFEEKPDSPIAANFKNSEEQISSKNEQISSDQTADLEDCYVVAEIGISKKEISTTKKKRMSKFQAFKTRLLITKSTKKSVSGNMASTGNHLEHPEKTGTLDAFEQDENSRSKRKRGFNFCGCLVCA